MVIFSVRVAHYPVPLGHSAPHVIFRVRALHIALKRRV